MVPCRIEIFPFAPCRDLVDLKVDIGKMIAEKIPHQAGLGSQTSVVHTVDKTESRLGGILFKDG